MGDNEFRDAEEYINDFNNAKVLFKDLNAALMVSEYYKSLEDIGNCTAEIGDIAIIKAIFLPSGKHYPPWALEEAIVLDTTVTSVKILIEIKNHLCAFWVPNWVVKDIKKNNDIKVKQSAEKIRSNSSITNIKIDLGDESDKNKNKQTEEIARILLEDIKKTTKKPVKRTVKKDNPKNKDK
jgi:hypothetical protein